MKPKLFVDLVGWGAFNLLRTRLVAYTKEYAKATNPRTKLEQKKNKYKAIFVMKLQKCQHEKYFAKKLATALVDAFERTYYISPEIHDEEAKGKVTGNSSTEKVYQYFYQMSETSAKLPQFRTYRKLRFSMFHDVMLETRAANNDPVKIGEVFDQWKGLCDYDLMDVEKAYILRKLKDFLHHPKEGKNVKKHIMVSISSLRS